MSNGEFLGGYALMILVIIVVCWRLNRRGPTPNAPLPVVPERPDPYSFAWLRGNTNEAIRLGVYDLMRSRLLLIQKQKRKVGLFSSNIDILAAVPLGSTTGLHPVAAIVHARTRVARPPSDLFGGGLSGDIAPLFSSVRKQAEADGLLHTPSSSRAAWLRLAWAAGAILTFGIVRLVWAVMEGRHNVGLIVAAALLGLVALVITAHPRRVTKRGATWLERAQQAYAKTDRSVEPAVLTVGLLGMAALSGTEFADLRQLFTKSTDSAGGCGSGCGSGSSCGSGCGGGGCGGGGD